MARRGAVPAVLTMEPASKRPRILGSDDNDASIAAGIEAGNINISSGRSIDVTTLSELGRTCADQCLLDCVGGR